MNAIAAWLGVLIGSALREALPAIVAVYREFRRATVEDSLDDPVLRDRLVAELHRRSENDPGGAGPTSTDPGNSPSGPGLGPGSERRPGRGGS